MSGEAPTDLSIVTVNYNAGDLLAHCVRSVIDNTHGVRFEHIVVDNASQRRDVLDRIEREFPHVCVLKNTRNLGFAGGCNVGLERTKGRYVLLLNPDALVGPRALDRMVAFLDSRPDVAVLGSPLVYPDGRDQRVAARGFPTPLAGLFGRTSLLTRLFPRNRTSARFSSERDPNRSGPYEVDWVSGACMMVRSQAIDEAGMLDPGYFLMWEDADWCYRLHKAGWKVYCFDEANVIHAEGGSRDWEWRTLWSSTVAFHKGAYRYYRKHINPSAFDPTHLLVMGGLAGRTLLLLTTRSIKRIIRCGLPRSKKVLSPEVEGRGLDAPVDR